MIYVFGDLLHEHILYFSRPMALDGLDRSSLVLVRIKAIKQQIAHNQEKKM